MQKLIIIDGNAIIHRGYHAIPPMTTQGGVLVNAVYGFASMLLKVWRELKPDYIAVTFDMSGPTFRHKKFEAYKATRVKADQALYDQIPLVHELVEAFGFPIYEKKGYEADDVIGTIVEEIKKSRNQKINELEAYIVTGDMDTLQLIQDNVKVYTLRKGLADTVVYDTAGVKERFGFGPEMMVDYKALRGDASDNIPGVPGIGEKGATDLITKIGGIDEIYRQIRNPKSEIRNQFSAGVIKKLEAGKESAEMSRELATIDCAVPDLKFKLEDCAVKNFNREKTVGIFQKFEFVSLLKRVPGFEREESGIKNQELREKKSKVKNAKSEFTFTEVKNKTEVDSLIELIKKNKAFACRAVTSGADVFTGELRGLVVVVEHRGWFVPTKFLGEFKTIFADEAIELVGHDLKQLVKTLAVSQTSPQSSPLPRGGRANPLASANRRPSEEGERAGGEVSLVVCSRLFDTMIASYLLRPGSRAHDVPSIVLKVLGKELTAGSGQDSLFGVDNKVAAHELFLISQTAEKLKKELATINNLGLFEKVEMPLIPVLAEMELNGISVDTKKLAELSTRVAKQVKDVSATIYKLAGQEFNISSPIQLREILFDKLEIPVEGIKKGKTGLSTGAEQLEKMRGLHPIIDEIEIYREITKLQNTYIDVLPTLVNKVTHRIHTTFNQAVAATGRLSSTDPNLQNIPIRTVLGREVREAFVAEPGNILVSADYSQIELRIVASLAEDKKMMEIFEQGLDIHAATAAAINNVPLDKVTKDMRRAAKEVNFGVLYGMGTHGLSWRADIPYGQAKAFIEKYFSEFSGVKKYLDRTLEFTKKAGYCETLFGRRRYIPELTAPNHQLRAAGERMAINHPIQGTAADLMKMGMIAVHDVIARSIATRQSPRGDRHAPLGLAMTPSDVKMILQVHDELVFEVKKGSEHELATFIKPILEGVVKLRVPVEVHVSTGHSWGKMERI